jgi:glucose-6-phosphate 1-epimerase
VDDPVLGRRLRIATVGTQSTVVWNPGRPKAQAMADLDGPGSRRLLCVESGNVGADTITVAGGGRAQSEVTISRTARGD